LLDGYEEVFALNAGMGLGIVRLKSSTEKAGFLRDKLYSIGKKNKGKIRTAGSGGWIV